LLKEAILIRGSAGNPAAVFRWNSRGRNLQSRVCCRR